METMPLKEEFIIYSSQEEGVCHTGKHQYQEVEGVRGEHDHEPLLWF